VKIVFLRSVRASVHSRDSHKGSDDDGSAAKTIAGAEQMGLPATKPPNMNFNTSKASEIDEAMEESNEGGTAKTIPDAEYWEKVLYDDVDVAAPGVDVCASHTTEPETLFEEQQSPAEQLDLPATKPPDMNFNTNEEALGINEAVEESNEGDFPEQDAAQDDAAQAAQDDAAQAAQDDAAQAAHEQYEEVKPVQSVSDKKYQEARASANEELLPLLGENKPETLTFKKSGLNGKVWQMTFNGQKITNTLTYWAENGFKLPAPAPAPVPAVTVLDNTHWRKLKRSELSDPERWERIGDKIFLMGKQITEIRPSSIENAGEGLFASINIPTGIPIGVFTGRQLGSTDNLTLEECLAHVSDKVLALKIPVVPSEWLPQAKARYSCKEKLPVNAVRKTYVDSTDGTTGYVQKSNDTQAENANAKLGESGILKAARRIVAGEEILWHYGESFRRPWE